jgi:hypothetical protein
MNEDTGAGKAMHEGVRAREREGGGERESEREGGRGRERKTERENERERDGGGGREEREHIVHSMRMIWMKISFCLERGIHMYMSNKKLRYTVSVSFHS